MQHEFIGRGQYSSIKSELTRLSAKRVFLITGKAAYETCGAKDLLKPILANYEVVSFDDFSPNPTFIEVMAGVAKYNKNTCDTIITIGGGSAIDLGKSINALQAHRYQERELAIGATKVYKKLAPLIAIPTTAGTGSEATHFAVIYVDGDKYSLASPNILPDSAIVDACFTDNLPPYITACTGFDALCQAIESYWSVGSTEKSREYSASAIQLLIPQLAACVSSPTPKARDDVIKAANLAGKAINISKTTAPHALSYTITSEFDVPHGHAVALTLAEFFSIHAEAIDADVNLPGGLTEFSSRMESLFSLLEVESACEAQHMWYKLMHACGLNRDLKDCGISKEGQASKIIQGVNIERLGNHPMKLTAKMLRSVFGTLE